MTRDLPTVKKLWLRAVQNGEVTVRTSRGTSVDGLPEGWDCFDIDGIAVDSDGATKLGSLERDGYIDCPDAGPVRLTRAGEQALQ